uniref:Uncharacterized protein n=1 Tax=Anguilla anguilla TaxID=7936 RepID=A0A0E9S4P9_ANGAN
MNVNICTHGCRDILMLDLLFIF